jgi:ferritin-like metal-binding protein YciE
MGCVLIRGWAALAKMIEGASSEELAAAFQEHLEQTQEQVRRLDRIFEAMSETPGGKTCAGTQGLSPNRS